LKRLLLEANAQAMFAELSRSKVDFENSEAEASRKLFGVRHGGDVNRAERECITAATFQEVQGGQRIVTLLFAMS